MANGAFWWKSVRVSLAATVVAIFSATGSALAQSGPPCPGTGGQDPNTFYGMGAGASITTGCSNSGFGFDALNAESTGLANTAVGAEALENENGTEGNTAVGFGALKNENGSGGGNTAVGEEALHQDTTGTAEVGIGSAALVNNTTGNDNVGVGTGSLFYNTTGNDNVAIGGEALRQLLTGSDNVALGSAAGFNLNGSESGDIYIGNEGMAGESDTIRIGTQPGFCGGVLFHCPQVYIAGIFSTPMSKSSARTVLIDSSGHLGIQVSSARYKRDIRAMGNSSAKLMKLRPVSFRYKQDPDGSVQYGLIAEEVAPVYPELVTRGSDGKVQGVRYDLLPAMLLNEVQKQARENKRLRQEIDALKKKDAQVDALTERLNALEREVRAARPERMASAIR